MTEVPVLDRACPRCARFVKRDAEVFVNGLGELLPQDNATCSKCGRVRCSIADWIAVDTRAKGGKKR